MRMPTRRGRAPEDEAPANEEKAAASGGPAPTAADPLGGVNAKVAKRQRMILAVMGSVVLAAGGSYVISRSDTKSIRYGLPSSIRSKALFRSVICRNPIP